MRGRSGSERNAARFLTALSRVFLSAKVSQEKRRFSKMSVPVDARYFPRGGVWDIELEAMEVLKGRRQIASDFFCTDKIRWHNQSLLLTSIKRWPLHPSLVTVSNTT